jgi:RNA polymerase sigma-B factor
LAERTVLTKDEVREIFISYGAATTEDERAEYREQLVEQYIGLVEFLARRFRNRGEPLEDLTQVGTIGLLKAIERFDLEREVEFSTYATPTIVGELKRHFRDKGWSLHVPRDLQERSLAVSHATEVLSKELGRSPKVREVAEHLGCSAEQVLEAQEAAASYEATSLDAPAARDDDESASLVDLLGSDDSAYELVEDRAAIASTWHALPDVERKVVELRFMHDLTQREIGEQIGYSQMHVSRLLRRALNRLETAAAAA